MFCVTLWLDYYKATPVTPFIFRPDPVAVQAHGILGGGVQVYRENDTISSAVVGLG